MNTTAAEALYELHIDAFLEGVADEAPNGEDFGLTEEQASACRHRVISALDTCAA